MKITIFTLIRMIRLIGFNIQDIQIPLRYFRSLRPILLAKTIGFVAKFEDWYLVQNSGNVMFYQLVANLQSMFPS
jgi:hypothetical protein